MSNIVNVETLLYIIKSDKILLIKKKRGLGAGLYNGVGGKVELGESPDEAAIRETIEEIGVKPKNVEWIGLLEFHNDFKLYGFVFVYVADDYEGEIRETDEAEPVWFDLAEIPFDNMWEDDRYWMPYLIKKQKFYGRFFFMNNWGKLYRSELYLLSGVKIEDRYD